MSKFNVKDKVVLTEKGKKFLTESRFPHPTGVGTILRGRVDGKLYNKVAFPGLTDRQNDLLCYSDDDLEFYRMPYAATDEGRAEAVFEVGDKVTLTKAATEYLYWKGYRVPFGVTAEVVAPSRDDAGKRSYRLDLGAGYEQVGMYVGFYPEDLVRVNGMDELIGKNVVLTLEAHKNFKEVAGLSATYGVVGARRVDYYGIEFEGIRGKRWFRADEFHVLPI